MRRQAVKPMELVAAAGLAGFVVVMIAGARSAPPAPYVPRQAHLLLEVGPPVVERKGFVTVKVCALSRTAEPLQGRSVIIEASSGQFLSENREDDLGESFVEVTGADGCAWRQHWDASASPTVRIIARSGAHEVERSYMIVDPGRAPHPAPTSAEPLPALGSGDSG